MRYLMLLLVCSVCFTFVACKTAQKEEPVPQYAERTVIEEKPTEGELVDHSVAYSTGMYLPSRQEVYEHRTRRITTVTKVEIDENLAPDQQKVISKQVSEELTDDAPTRTTKSVFIHREQYDTYFKDWHDAQHKSIKATDFMH